MITYITIITIITREQWKLQPHHEQCNSIFSISILFFFNFIFWRSINNRHYHHTNTTFSHTLMHIQIHLKLFANTFGIKKKASNIITQHHKMNVYTHRRLRSDDVVNTFLYHFRCFQLSVLKKFIYEKTHKNILQKFSFFKWAWTTTTLNIEYKYKTLCQELLEIAFYDELPISFFAVAVAAYAFACCWHYEIIFMCL